MQDGEEKTNKTKVAGLKANLQSNLSAFFAGPRASFSGKAVEKKVITEPPLTSLQPFEASLPLPAQFGLTRLQQLQKHFIGHVSIALDSKGHPRTLIAEGFLKKIGKKNLNKRYYFILLNDILVYAASTSKGFVLHQQVNLTDVKIIRSTRSERLFHVQGGPKPFTCVTETRDERDDWVGSITSCLPDTNNQMMVFHGTLVKLQPTKGKESLKYFFLFGDGTLKWGDTEDTIRHTEMVKDVLTHDQFLSTHYGIGSKVPLELRPRFLGVLTQKSERALCLLSPSKEPLTLIQKWWETYPLNPIFFTSRAKKTAPPLPALPPVKKTPAHSPTLPPPGRASVAAPVAKTYDILACLMMGDFNGVVSDTRVLLSQCTTNDLVANLPVIACCLFETPLFLRVQAKALIDCIKTRAAISGPVAQGVYGLLSSSLFEGSWGYTDWLSDLDRCGDICIAFGELTDPNIQVIGNVLEVPDELQVFHPFDGHRVRRLQIDSIFNTNAKPLLLTVHCSRDEDGVPPYRGMHETQEVSVIESFEERSQSFSIIPGKESFAYDHVFSDESILMPSSPDALTARQNRHSFPPSPVTPGSTTPANGTPGPSPTNPTSSPTGALTTTVNTTSALPVEPPKVPPPRSRTPSMTMRRIGISRVSSMLPPPNKGFADENSELAGKIREIRGHSRDRAESEDDISFRPRTSSTFLTPTSTFPTSTPTSVGPRRESKTAATTSLTPTPSLPVTPVSTPATVTATTTTHTTATATTTTAANTSASKLKVNPNLVVSTAASMTSTPSPSTISPSTPTKARNSTSDSLPTTPHGSPSRRSSITGPPARPPPRTPTSRPPPRPSLAGTPSTPSPEIQFLNNEPLTPLGIVQTPFTPTKRSTSAPSDISTTTLTIKSTTASASSGTTPVTTPATTPVTIPAPKPPPLPTTTTSASISPTPSPTAAKATSTISTTSVAAPKPPPKRFSQTAGSPPPSPPIGPSSAPITPTSATPPPPPPTTTTTSRTAQLTKRFSQTRSTIINPVTTPPPLPPHLINNAATSPRPLPPHVQEVENFLLKRAEVHPEVISSKPLAVQSGNTSEAVVSVEIVPVGSSSIRVATAANTSKHGILRPAKAATAFVVKLETAMPTLEKAQDVESLAETSPSEGEEGRPRPFGHRRRHQRSSDGGSGMFHRVMRSRSGQHNLSVDRTTFMRDEDDSAEQSVNSRNQRWVTFEAGKIIFKTGDDLRQDVACVHIFQMLNTVWKQAKVEYRGHTAQARCYGVTALSPHMGCVQFVPDCKPLRNVREMFEEGGEATRFYNKEWSNRMIATGAGGYISAYVLGIRDRHHDNILVEPNGTLFHIDFGHILGESVTIDTASFAITPELKQVMGDENWNEFVNLCVETFAAVRANVEIVMSFCTMMLSSFIPKHQVVQFLRNSLMLSEDLGSACYKLRGKIEAAPRSFKTRTKNVLHAVATDVNFKEFLSLATPSASPSPRGSYAEPR